MIFSFVFLNLSTPVSSILSKLLELCLIIVKDFHQFSKQQIFSGQLLVTVYLCLLIFNFAGRLGFCLILTNFNSVIFFFHWINNIGFFENAVVCSTVFYCAFYQSDIVIYVFIDLLRIAIVVLLLQAIDIWCWWK